MNVLNAVTRIVLTLAVILFLIIRWALVPYLTDASIDTPVVSIFWEIRTPQVGRATFYCWRALFWARPWLCIFLCRRFLCLAILI